METGDQFFRTLGVMKRRENLQAAIRRMDLIAILPERKLYYTQTFSAFMATHQFNSHYNSVGRHSRLLITYLKRPFLVKSRGST